MSGISIQQKVAEGIAASGETVANTVIAKLVEVEVNKRTELITSGLAKLETLQKEYKKENKADVFLPVTTVGDKPGEAFSAEKSKKLVELKGKIDALTSAIDTALEKNDGDSYNKLSGLVK